MYQNGVGSKSSKAFRTFGLSLFLSGVFASLTLAGTFRAQLSLFMDVAEQDSVLSLTQIGANQIEVELKAPGEIPPRKIRQSVPPIALEKLVASARVEGVETRIETVLPTASDAGETEQRSRSLSSNRKNRLQYVAAQSIFSSYTYGYALTNALELEGKAAISVFLFSITGSIAGHSIYAYRRSFEDAHIFGLGYAAGVGFSTSLVLPFLFMGPDENGLRAGWFLTLGAYPASVWLGYKHGDAYVENPGRIALEPVFSWPWAVAGGIFLPMLYFGEDTDISPEFAVRLMAGQALALGAAGHFASHRYRRGEYIPGGVPGGILTHTMFGFLGGLSLAISNEADNVRGYASMILFPSVAGFLEGLWFFRNSSDNLERGKFSSLGALGGATFAGGILVLAEPDDPGTIVWTLTLGSLAGYAITYALLKNQVEKVGYSPVKSGSLIRRVEMNLLPIPDVRKTAEGKLALGYRVPGLTLRF